MSTGRTFTHTGYALATPFPYKGAQGLRTLPPDVVATIMRQLEGNR